MIALLVRARSEPPPDLPASHRTWWIYWQYGRQEGWMCCALCVCEEGLHAGHRRPQDLHEALRAAIDAAKAREHRLLSV